MPTLITGAAGQDGRLLARLLAKSDTKIYGTCRPGQKSFLSKYCPTLEIIEIDLSYEDKILDLLNKVKPNKIYNLAGFSSVSQSWKNPELATRLNSVLPSIILKWCLEVQPSTRFVQASSSEIFGEGKVSPQSERSEIAPITPYGLSKSLAHSLVQQFRNEFGLFASNIILYNHESPLRSKEFVTRKITSSVAAIANGSKELLHLGQISAKRDWGWAPDYVIGMQKVMNHSLAEDFLLATGEVHSVEEVLKYAFSRIGVSDFSNFVVHDVANDRHIDPKSLVGDASRAKSELNWQPSRNLQEAIGEMVDFDNKLTQNPELQWFPDFM